jgi:hypothetical protein
MLTLSVRGFAYIGFKAGNPYQILLNPAGGHVPTLTILTKYLEPIEDDATRWDPDVLGFVPVLKATGAIFTFDQVGIWHLKGKKVTFNSGGGSLGGWADRHNTIAFDDFHPDCTRSSNTTGFTIITVAEGTPSSETPSEYTIANKMGTNPIVTRDCANEVRFTGVPLEIMADGRTIRFKSTVAQPIAVISNLAAEPNHDDALKHFIHYYDIVLDKDGNEIDGYAKISVHDAADEVYDCVPPTTGP